MFHAPDEQNFSLLHQTDEHSSVTSGQHCLPKDLRIYVALPLFLWNWPNHHPQATVEMNAAPGHDASFVGGFDWGSSSVGKIAISVALTPIWPIPAILGGS
jgi:hypothetical protein